MNDWLVLAILAVIVIAAVYTRPRWADATIALLRRLAGYEMRTVNIDGFKVVYFESGPQDAPALLLLHGFGGDADNWTFFTPLFNKQFRVIIPDLPGFGQTGYVAGADYALYSQVGRLREFMDYLKVERAHVVGNSMGGYIGAAFAANHPERVLSLGLFNAAGVDMPRKSPFYEAALEGRNLLLVRERDDFERLLTLVYHKKPWLPGYLKQAITAHSIKVAGDQDIIFQGVFGERVWLDTHMQNIKAPTLILWGDDDRVLDISSVDLFKAGIPHADVAIIPACGHVPMLEKPRETAKLYRDFLARAGFPATLPGETP